MLILTQPITVPCYQQGGKAVLRNDYRWARSDIKSTSLLGNVLLRHQSVLAEADETLLLRDGFVMEGSASNVFMVKDGIIYTPPLSNYLLPGITREILLELLRNNQFDVRELPISEEMLHSADEVWILSSIREIMPITEIDQNSVGQGEIGPMWRKVMALFQDNKSGTDA